MTLDVVFSVEPGLLEFLKNFVFAPGQLDRIERKLDTMNTEIAALKANFDTRISEIQTALTNIAADIHSLQQSSSLVQEDKDTLTAISSAMDNLASGIQAVDQMEPKP